MSTRKSREADRGETENPAPACITSLNVSDEWEERPSAVYPPGYMALCELCFGDLVPGDAWNEDGTADWDHSRVTDTLVRSDKHGTTRRLHLPDGHPEAADYTTQAEVNR